jgi:ABC-type thiamine transport system ATPase subunit
VGFQNGLLSLLDGFEIPDQFEDCLASIKAQLKDSARRQVSLFFQQRVARTHPRGIDRA